MHFDEIIEKIGSFGFYQKYVYFLVCLPAIFCGIQMTLSVFILGVPNHRCSIPNYHNDTYSITSVEHELLVNHSIPQTKTGYSQCSRYDVSTARNHETNNVSQNSCQEWVFSEDTFTRTAVTEYNLICDNSLKTSHATMIMMGGVLIGAVILGTMSDVFGRRKIMFGSLLLNLASGLATGWAPSFAVFCLFRFLVGASTSGIFITSFVIGVELVGPGKRKYVGIVIEFFFAGGETLLAGLAYWIRDWRYLSTIVSAPTVLFLLYWWLIPESPRWLLSQKRFSEAEKIIRRAAKINKVQLPENLFIKFNEYPKQSIWKVIHYPMLFVRSIVVFFNWMVISMVYYGLSLNTGNLGGSVYINFLISALVEFPSYVLCLLLLDRMGRKKLHAVTMIVGGLSCISTIFTIMYGGPSAFWLTITLAMIGKLCSASAFAIIYVYTGELYPTVVRHAFVGAGSMFARFGSMAAPYIADAAKIVGGDIGRSLPMIIFGTATVLAGLLSLLLPETLNQPLPETLQEGNELGRKIKKKTDSADEKSKMVMIPNNGVG